MRLHASLIAALVVAFAAPASAQATAWVTSGPLSPADRTAVDPQIVLTPDGGRVIAWSQRGPDGNMFRLVPELVQAWLEGEFVESAVRFRFDDDGRPVADGKPTMAAAAAGVGAEAA